MKKILFIAIAIMLTLPSILTADEIELGLALTPMSILMDEDQKSYDAMADESGGVLNDFVLGLHAGYSLGGLLYASIDANAMPPWLISDITRPSQNEPGIFAPGFVTFIDAGIRPKIGNIIPMAAIGFNYLYIHSGMVDKEGDSDSDNKLGVNLRLGVGYSFAPFSVNLVVTSIFSTFDNMAAILEGLANDEMWAKESLNLIPSLAFYIHL
jgi:hypothetical protein